MNTENNNKILNANLINVLGEHELDELFYQNIDDNFFVEDEYLKLEEKIAEAVEGAKECYDLNADELQDFQLALDEIESYVESLKNEDKNDLGYFVLKYMHWNGKGANLSRDDVLKGSFYSKEDWKKTAEKWTFLYLDDLENNDNYSDEDKEEIKQDCLNCLNSDKYNYISYYVEAHSEIEVRRQDCFNN